VQDYEQMVEEILPRLGRENLGLAVRMASFPEEIRGFGHVKLESATRVRPHLLQLRTQWSGGQVAADV